MPVIFNKYIDNYTNQHILEIDQSLKPHTHIQAYAYAHVFAQIPMYVCDRIFNSLAAQLGLCGNHALWSYLKVL